MRPAYGVRAHLLGGACACALVLGSLGGCEANPASTGAQRSAGAGHGVTPPVAACPMHVRLRPHRRVRVGLGVGALALDGESVWAARAQAGTVTRIGPSSLWALHVGPTPVGLALGNGQLWVALRDAGRVVSVDTRRISLRHSTAIPLPVSVLASGGQVWAMSLDSGTLLQLNPRTGAPGEPLYAPVGDPIDMAQAGGELWVLGAREGGLSPFDPRLGRIMRSGFDIPGRSLSGLSASGSTIWLGEPTRRALLRIDASTVAVSELHAPASVRPDLTSVGGCGIWVGSRSGMLELLDSRTGALVAPAVRVGRAIAALAAYGNGVWASDPVDGTVVYVSVGASG